MNEAGTTKSTEILDVHGSGWNPAIRFALLAMLGLGLLFPTLAALIGQGLFPEQAVGSLIVRDGHIVGSALVAQPFLADRYFQSRPSASNYDLRALAGSNLAPSNPALRERIIVQSAAIATRENTAISAIPIDLITTSGSGIDPHISPEAATLQVPRVASARKLDPAQVKLLVDRHTREPTFGLFGRPRVNVLELNLDLDAPIP